MRIDRDDRRHVLRACFERAELTTGQLWRRYFALGGEAGPADVEAHLHGGPALPAVQADLLAHAVNERLDELTEPRRVGYFHPVRDARPASPLHRALLEVLDGMHLAPPERIAAVTAAAGRALDVEVTVHLVDHEQRHLHALGGDAGGPGLAVDATLGGQAFRRTETLPSEAADGPRLWVPLLDGVERMGVLEVRVGEVADLYDPGLREQCRQLASLVGRVAHAVAAYGDGLEAARRTRPRSAGAELVWQLLAPLTAGTERCTVAGLVEPAYDVAGDAFDYALSEATARLAVFDPAGPGQGVVTAAALAAYRSTRRNGGGLFAQANAVDDTVAELSGAQPASVAGVLAELDLDTGRLRYLTAGHPSPLVLRDGRVVRTLGATHRPPFGSGAMAVPAHLDTVAVTVEEEVLQPGDRLVLHTDGITGARDREGHRFGESRLADLLSREFAAGDPAPETVRRLVAAVLRHQGGALQDDAAVLLVHWDPTRRGGPAPGGRSPVAGTIGRPDGSVG